MKTATKEAPEMEMEEVSTEATKEETPKTETPDERAARISACEKEMAQVLSKYNCGLTAQMIINENGAVPQVFIKIL